MYINYKVYSKMYIIITLANCFRNCAQITEYQLVYEM